MLRPVGFTLAALLAAPVAGAQVPGSPPVAGQPPAGAPAGHPPAAQPPAAQPDAKLDAHLRGWEAKMSGLQNFRADIALTRKEAVFNKNRKYTGSVLCMKPNLAVLRLDSATDKVDYEAFVCTGDAVYEYSGLQQAVTKYKINPGAAGDNLMLDFLSGMKAEEAKRRFQLSVFNEDANYVYLDIKPLQQKDRAEFEHVRFALYGPTLQQLAYLPAQVWLQKPNGDTELWEFTKPQTNVPGVDKAIFRYTPVKGKDGKDWPLKEFQPQPPGGPGQLPGGRNLPPGAGAVKKP
jgi:TIGR03009 family protein